MNETYTLQEVAALLECSTTTVFNYEKKQLIRRVADPHNLRSTIHFFQEEVDQLAEQKKQLAKQGKSVTELAKEQNVYPVKIKEAIDALHLKVESVPTGLGAISQRYCITPELEKQIVHFIENQKVPRPKRNHFYRIYEDLALYQAFRLAGEETLRLKINKRNVLGFAIGENEFMPYVDALKTLDIEPLYPIHQPRNRIQNGFTDIEVPIGKKAFYHILDALYTICGVENFNAEVRKGKACLSIRNGSYPLNKWATEEALAALKNHMKSGEIEVTNGEWHFKRTSLFIQLEFETAEYASIKQLAKEAGISPRAWIHQAIEEKQAVSKKKQG